MSIEVLKKSIRRKKEGPPCAVDDFFSLDGGATWISNADYYKWYNSLVTITPLYKY